MAAWVGTAGAVDGAGAVDTTGAIDVVVFVGAVDALGAAGAAAESAARDAVRAGLELTSTGFCSAFFPLQVATTRTSARLVIFQGFFQLSFSMSTALL